MYKVFINDTLFLIANNFNTDHYILLDDFFSLLKKKSFIKKKYNVLCSSFQDFTSFFKIIQAGGGVVVNNNKILFIYRNNKWDLPKGKQEKNELIENTALREVKEETSLKKLEIDKFLDKTYHIYYDKFWILKVTDWFLMKSHFYDVAPQFNEGITMVKWIDRKEMYRVLKKTYPSIRYLLKDF